MTSWSGIDVNLTPVADAEGVSEYEANTRLRIAGELGRRYGFQSSSIAQQAGAILNIASANVAGGNYLTFDVDDGSGSGGAMTGQSPIPPPPIDGPKRKKPVIINGGTCTAWAAFSDQGTSAGGVFNHALPFGSCAGTLSVTGVEDTRRGRSNDYGYSFTATADGVPILNSGCLVSASTQVAIPPGTLLVSITVNVNCAGGTDVGEWSLQGTCP